MSKFKVVNNGVKNIDWLINKYVRLEITPKTINELKTEVFDSFINNHYVDFSTKGNVSVTIVDLTNMTTCEIIYN